MATTVTYGVITLHNVLTRQWEQELVYDSSGTDLLYSKYNLSFSGVLHVQRIPIQSAESYVGNSLLPTTLGYAYEYVRAQLSSPRSNLTVDFGTEEVLKVTPPTRDTQQLPTVDVKNGPHPKVIEIQPIGSSLLKITFSIECALSECGQYRSADSLVLNNRWKISETMDANFHTSRMISGKLQLAVGSTWPSSGFPAHYHKATILPPLEDSFRRERVNFSCDETGLVCTYDIVDKQVHQAAPWPATQMEARHTETTSNGTAFYSEINVRLTGDPAVSKLLLIERAIQIANQRLALLSAAMINSEVLVEHCSITDHIGAQSTVELSMRLRRTGATLDVVLYKGLSYKNLGKSLELPSLTNAEGPVEGTEYDTQKSRVPKPYGYKGGSDLPEWERRPAVLYFLHCYLQSPCELEHAVGPRNDQPRESDSTEESEGRYGGEGTPVTESPGNLDYEPITDQYSDDARKQLYTISRMTNRYHIDDNVHQLPYSGGGNNSYLFDVGGSSCWRYIEIDAERVGAMPVIPDPYQIYYDKRVFARRRSFDVQMLPPAIAPDGQQIVFRVIAKYLYYLDRIPEFSSQDGVPVGNNPIANFNGYDGKLRLRFGKNLGLDDDEEGESTASNTF